MIFQVNIISLLLNICFIAPIKNEVKFNDQITFSYVHYEIKQHIAEMYKLCEKQRSSGQIEVNCQKIVKSPLGCNNIIQYMLMHNMICSDEQLGTTIFIL